MAEMHRMMVVSRSGGGRMASSIGKERLPRGSRGWRTFVEALAQVDDTAETHWLEMKSSLDLSRTGAAKIAKFILGAANRQPEAAASALDGYALMVLGSPTAPLGASIRSRTWN